jgi:hypothetical protein
LRELLVGGLVLLMGVFAVVFFRTRSRPEPAPTLVRGVPGTLFVDAVWQDPYVFIRNRSADRWASCTLTLNGRRPTTDLPGIRPAPSGWSRAIEEIAPGAQHRYPRGAFANANDTPLTADDEAIRTLALVCTTPNGPASWAGVLR